jgi:DNA invertase Pin-like site-specific DNA recombinase
MVKAYGYLRVSGKGQVDGDGFPRQRAAIERQARVEIAGWFEERGVAGVTEWDARPAWVEMLDKIVNNGVKTIVIERLDRLARDLMVQEHIIADLRKRGIELISTEEPDLGSTEPARVLMRQVMGAVAQYDKAMIVLKLRGARQRKKAREGKCEGRKPYGFYEGEAAILAEIRLRVGKGVRPALIAKELNLRNVTARSGGQWHPYVVSRIIEKIRRTP